MKVFMRILVLFILLLLLMLFKEKLGSIDKSLTRINIVYDGIIPLDGKRPIKLVEYRDADQFAYQGEIERRGGYSISFPKHSFEVDLDLDVSLAQLPYDDDWILNANYIDKTFLRHVISYELFADMDKDNIASACQFIELELNDSYNGLYVLMEKLDKSSLGLNASDTSAFIFKEPQIFRASYDRLQPQDASNFHQQTFPKINKLDKRVSIESIRDFLLNAGEEEFEAEFKNLFDIDNIIDWHLLLLMSNNNDGILKNFYLYKKNSTSPIRIAPWDYDHSFGRDGDNELNMDERSLKIHRSILFRRLLRYDWYKKALRQRWDMFNNAGLLSREGLQNRVIKKSEIIVDAARKNFQLWSADSKDYYDDNNFEKEIEIMLRFIDIRHKRLSEYFNELK